MKPAASPPEDKRLLDEVARRRPFDLAVCEHILGIPRDQAARSLKLDKPLLPIRMEDGKEYYVWLRCPECGALEYVSDLAQLDEKPSTCPACRLAAETRRTITKEA